MNEILIRPAAVADAIAWLAMRVALYGDDPSLKPEVDDYFAGNSPIEAVYIADDGDPVGFMELDTRPYAEGCVTSPVAYVEGLYVVPEKRRLGIGRLLIAQAEDWARKRGLTELASDALIGNEASIAMHKALGFAEVERIVCLRKSLVPLSRKHESATGVANEGFVLSPNPSSRRKPGPIE